MTQDKNFPRAEAAAESGLRGAFAFPLFANDEINGVIELFDSSIVQPDDDLLQMVDSLGIQIGLFIHRHEMEKELQEEKENAEAANASKDRFLATLSHELRTPLTPVLIWAGGMIKQPDLPADLVQGLEMVCRNVELEARLIDDLLDLTRIARGKLQLDLRPADAHELMRHAMDIVRADISARRINVLIALDAPEHHVVVDSARLQQAFWNLLRNAYKFTGDHGTVSIRSSNPMPGKLRIDNCRQRRWHRTATSRDNFSMPLNKSAVAVRDWGLAWPSAKRWWKCTAEKYPPRVKAWAKVRNS